MNERLKVVALGELLIDFTEYGQSLQGNPVLEANPGGAPCNVLSMMKKLGDDVHFVGKVGDDFFGHFLAERLGKLGIGTEYLSFDLAAHTTLAFVHNHPDGEREFGFYRNEQADTRLDVGDVPLQLIREADLFHFGTLSMTHPQAKQATRLVVDTARENGVPVSFDPNLRLALWQQEEDARKAFAYGMERCDILKISDNEILWYTGEADLERAAAKLRREFPTIRLMVLSKGKDGSSAYWKGPAGKDIAVSEPAFLREDTIDTTGAGDTFGACIFHFALQYGLEDLNEKKLRFMLRFAGAAASIVTSRKGALSVMPEQEEVEKILQGSESRSKQ
ncbi:MAG: carbohydrate kinase [Lachnospiraceae bacterium]|nr:carbohydrate kinase [Lachnospiraceae bacterium]